MSKKKKLSLRDLSREALSPEESRELRIHLINADDLRVAISASSYAERELEELIFYRLKITDLKVIKDLTEDGGPLCTFNDKIEFGQALQLFPEEVAHNLHIVRRIRNVFAHSLKILKFSHPLINAEIQKTRMYKPMDKDSKRFFKKIIAGTFDSKISYYLVCLDCQLHLMKRTHKFLSTSQKARERRRQKRLAEIFSGEAGKIIQPAQEAGLSEAQKSILATLLAAS